MFMQYKFQIIKLDRVVCQGQEMSHVFKITTIFFQTKVVVIMKIKKRVLVKFHMIFKNW